MAREHKANSMNIFGKPARIASVLLASTVLVACDNLSIPDFGSGPDPVPSVSRPTPDARGVISYGTYQVMVASPGDTLASMAQRVGIPSEELARHNGLPVSYVPRPGENLALPRTVAGAITPNATGWTPDIAISAIDNSVTNQTGTFTTTAPSASLDGEPIRHRVEQGETAYSIARLYNVSVTALASWNGLGPDLSVRLGQQLTIPVPVSSLTTTVPTVTPVVPAPVVALTPVVTAEPVVPPVVAPTPTPEPVAAPTSTFLKPVDGSVSRPYNPQSGPNKNDGIDYAAAAGSNVRVAANGTVALVSQSTGGLGTIVLVRHANDLLTIYGRVDNVTVSKGDTVTRGQIIGVVAASDNPTMHFEVRKGTDSVDPAPYLR